MTNRVIFEPGKNEEFRKDEAAAAAAIWLAMGQVQNKHYNIITLAAPAAAMLQ